MAPRQKQLKERSVRSVRAVRQIVFKQKVAVAQRHQMGVNPTEETGFIQPENLLIAQCEEALLIDGVKILEDKSFTADVGEF